LNKIRELDFMVLSLSSNDVPKTVRKFLPPSSPVQALGDENEVKPVPDHPRTTKKKTQ